MSKRAYIYCAGSYSSDDFALFKRIKITPNDLVIAADGGYDAAFTVGITPDVVIGDLDSVRSVIPRHVPVIKHPHEKDETDLRLCVNYAIDAGCDEIILLGVLGDRLDHSMSAMIELRYILSKGANAMILSHRCRVYIIKDSINIKKDDYSKLSLIPANSSAEGVTTAGLRYPLSNSTLTQTDNLGISNEFTAEVASVTLTKGELYVICEV